MKKNSIRVKTGILIGIFLFEVLFLTSLLFFTVRKYENSVKMFSQEFEKQQLVNELQVALSNVEMPGNDFLIAGGGKNEAGNFKISSSLVERLFGELARNRLMSSKEREVLDESKKEYLRGKKIALKIFNLPDIIREWEGGLLMEEMDEAFNVDALRYAQKLEEYARQRTALAKVAFQKLSNAIAVLTLIAIAINVVFVLAFIIFFERTVLAPLVSLRSAALEVAAGNLDKRVTVATDNEIGEFASLFNMMVEKRKSAEEELKNEYQNQSVLNDLLKTSLENIPLQEVLEKIIDRLLTIPWFFLEKKGGIFLIEDNPQLLILKAQTGLAGPIQELCKNVPLGTCLCGRAALSKHIEFVHAVDERHENKYSNMPPHGHYCVPILSIDKKCLGVFNLYLKEGHNDSERERGFLLAVANVLAGIIERRLAEESLAKTYKELKETQEQVIQAEKFKAIGQLASGIAHEVRNPLAIIMQSADYLEIKLSSDKEVSEVARLIKDNIKRADNIICALVDFSKVTQLESEASNINSIIENSLLLIPRGFASESVEVIKIFGEPLPKVLVDTKKMTQVFINIFLNAIQAMPEGGKLFVRTYAAQFSKPLHDRGQQDLIKTGDTIVRVEIEDTGVGIPPEYLKRIYDPFFTTRGPQKGTGLGLTVTRNIIQMHKGVIDVESQVQKGTKFIITLKGIGE